MTKKPVVLKLPTGTVTFLMTDIEGSTKLWETHGHGLSKAIARHFALLERAITKHRGLVVKSVGDGVHAVFATAPDALAAALAGQKALHSENWLPGMNIRVRMVLHSGVAELRDQDYYGQTMNRAARLLDLGYGGQILLSEVACGLCVDSLPASSHLKPLGDHALRDLPRRESVYQLCLPDLPASFPPLRTAFVPFDPDAPSIAVLPFTDLSPEKDQEYFTDGLAEELLDVLSKIRGLRVASRTSAFSFKGKDAALPVIAKDLNVATVLEGSVRKVGKRMRITAQLVRVGTDSHIWSESYDRDSTDILAVQSDIAQAVVAALRRTLRKTRRETRQKATVRSPADASIRKEIQAAVLGRSKDPEAYRCFLQGRFFVNRWLREDVKKGIDYFRQTVERDSGFALAWAAMASAHAIAAGQRWVPPEEGYAKAREAAQRALSLEPNLPEGHLALGNVRMYYEWDWKGAEGSYRRALELAPSDAETLRGWATLIGNLGHVAQAVEVLKRATTFDPLSVTAYKGLGRWAFYGGQLDVAEAAFKKAIELHPQGGFARCWLGMVHIAQGQIDAAMRVVQDETEDIFLHQGMALAFEAAGKKARADIALGKLIAADPDGAAYQITQIYAFRGEVDRAFEWVQRGIEVRDPGFTHAKVDTLLTGLHSDPRWMAFLEKMQFPR